MFFNFIRALLLKCGFISKPDFIVNVMNSHPSPEKIDFGHLYLVKGGNVDKWACFRCPDGCNKIVKLSLSQKRRPRWSVSLDLLKRPTVYPSVRELEDCCAHYWIKKGKVCWCSDSGQI